MLTTYLVENPENLCFDVKILEHSLDYQIGVGFDILGAHYSCYSILDFLNLSRREYPATNRFI